MQLQLSLSLSAAVKGYLSSRVGSSSFRGISGRCKTPDRRPSRLGRLSVVVDLIPHPRNALTVVCA